MKRLTLLIFLGILWFNQSSAQFSGQLSSSVPVPQGYSRGGGYVGIYDGGIGVLGQYRAGVGSYTDIGFKLGIIDWDSNHGDNTGADLAFDLKYLVLEERLRDPINLSVGGNLELGVFEHVNIFSLGINTIGSYPVKLRNGRILDPYGRLLFRVERSDPDFGDGDTDFEIGFNMGVTFDLNRSTHALAEIQFDDPTAFFLGLSFGL